MIWQVLRPRVRALVLLRSPKKSLNFRVHCRTDLSWPSSLSFIRPILLEDSDFGDAKPLDWTKQLTSIRSHEDVPMVRPTVDQNTCDDQRVSL